MREHRVVQEQMLELTQDHDFEICNSEHHSAYFAINGELKSDGHAKTSYNGHELVLARSCARGRFSLFVAAEYRTPEVIKHMVRQT